MGPGTTPRSGDAIFIIGNTPDDAALIALLRRVGGDVVLTSACLLAAYDAEAASRLAEAELGRAVPAGELAQWRDGIARPAALLLGEVSTAARHLFVPSAWLAGEIEHRYGRRAEILPAASGARLARGHDTDVQAQAAGLHAEACVWAIEQLRFIGRPLRLTLDCPDADRPALAALAARLSLSDWVAFGAGTGRVAVVLAMRGGVARETALAMAAAGRCVASRCLVEAIDPPPWVLPVPDQPSPPLLAAAISAALALPAPDARGWIAAHDPAVIAARLA